LEQVVQGVQRHTLEFREHHLYFPRLPLLAEPALQIDLAERLEMVMLVERKRVLLMQQAAAEVQRVLELLVSAEQAVLEQTHLLQAQVQTMLGVEVEPLLTEQAVQVLLAVVLVAQLQVVEVILRQVVTQLQTRVAVVVVELVLMRQQAAMVVAAALVLLFSVT